MRQLVITALIVTGTLLLCDAWFDVTLSWGSNEQLSSILAALLVEIPFRARRSSSLFLRSHLPGLGPCLFLARALLWRRAASLRLQRHDPRLQRLIFVTRRDRHRFHRFKLVAADEIGPPTHSRIFSRIDAWASRPRRPGPGDAVDHLDEVVEHLVLGLHPASPLTLTAKLPASGFNV